MPANIGFCAIGGPPNWGTRGDGWYVNYGWGGPYRGWDWYWDRYRPYGYASGPVESRTGQVDWSLLPGVNPQNERGASAELPKAAPTKLELAHEAVVTKKFDEAAALYREHLKASPEDVEAMRELAVCMVEGKESGAGLAMLRDLYTKDPTLADRPFSGEAMGIDASRLRELVVKVSPIANKVKSPSAWLAIVVMMQAEGRKPDALRAIQKAKVAGRLVLLPDGSIDPVPSDAKRASATDPSKQRAPAKAAPMKPVSDAALAAAAPLDRAHRHTPVRLPGRCPSHRLAVPWRSPEWTAVDRHRYPVRSGVVCRKEPYGSP